MGRDGEALAAWTERLRLAEAELLAREQRALVDNPTAREMLALAAERDEIASGRDRIAQGYDDRAGVRDHAGLGRDVRGSARDRRARSLHEDLDPGFADRSLAGEDRDYAAGDRGDSFDDRARSRNSRERAGVDRQRAAVDRDRAAEEAAKQEREVDDLHVALETRLTIGQAQGLLMERHSISAEAAFAVLVRVSQDSNQKLREVAAQLVTAADDMAQRADPQRRG